jgi:ankyrin repeat protein
LQEGKSGFTPLHYAVQSNNHNLANYLMHECPKINLDVTSYSGLTAFQLAQRVQNQYLVKELTRQGAMCFSSEESETDDSDSDDEEDMVIIYFFLITKNLKRIFKIRENFFTSFFIL